MNEFTAELLGLVITIVILGILALWVVHHVQGESLIETLKDSWRGGKPR